MLSQAVKASHWLGDYGPPPTASFKLYIYGLYCVQGGGRAVYATTLSVVFAPAKVLRWADCSVRPVASCGNLVTQMFWVGGFLSYFCNAAL